MTRFCILLAVAMITATTATMANGQPDSTGYSSEADGRWIINHPDARRFYAVQCGLDVTLFALKYFKIDYSLVRVSLGLPLSTDGIALADVQQMLHVYGLEADARKGVTIRQIARRLNGEYIAIIPLGMGGGRNHYYIGALDDNGVAQLVNVGRGVSPLIRPDSPGHNDRIEKRFAEAGGIVLFVRKPAKAKVDLEPFTF